MITEFVTYIVIDQSLMNTHDIGVDIKREFMNYYKLLEKNRKH